MANRFHTRAMGMVGLMIGLFALSTLASDIDKPSYPKPPSAKNVKVMPEAWRNITAMAISSAELDQMLAYEIKNDKLRTAPLTTDEQFIRRATLDLTGKLPDAPDVVAFVKDSDAKKRSKLIDRLLGSDAYARHWARYWRDVVVSRATDMRAKRQSAPFEEWLYQQFKENRSWTAMAKDMIAAEGEYRTGPPARPPVAAKKPPVAAKDKGEEEVAEVAEDKKAKVKKKVIPEKKPINEKKKAREETRKEKPHNGAAYFVLAHAGVDGAVERAAETSRVFMGIQIQCAQCHDHPNDIWKRVQFHELTAFFARMRERIIRNSDGKGFLGIEIVSPPRANEHRMPDMDDPKKGTTVHPKFLTGQSIAHGESDRARRQALANYVTSKDNYWFAAAFVNRIWGELMGQAFYQPVDHMGPLQESTYPNVLMRLASAFRAGKYDVKQVFRLVMNSQTYQRQIRLGDSPDDHLHFTAAYPTKLRPDALWDSLENALGSLDSRDFPGRPRPKVSPLFRGGFQGVFMETFDFDPSTKSDEVESSVPQALLLMNNATINGRIRATGDTMLARLVRRSSDDDEVIKSLYLHTLARKPTPNELETCRSYVKDTSSRTDAFEDLLWSLINSTEFQTKR